MKKRIFPEIAKCIYFKNPVKLGMLKKATKFHFLTCGKINSELLCARIRVESCFFVIFWLSWKSEERCSDEFTFFNR